jgi:hypothetical protein
MKARGKHFSAPFYFVFNELNSVADRNSFNRGIKRQFFALVMEEILNQSVLMLMFKKSAFILFIILHLRVTV